MPKTSEELISAFRAGLDAETQSLIDYLRALIKDADNRLEEDFKWNAPSFRLEDEHRVTLGIDRKGGVRVVLHRGVTKKDVTHFQFSDVDGLALWPDRDRGVMTWRSLEEVGREKDALQALVRRWTAVS